MHLSPRRALLWSFAERYASFVVTVASTLLLARLLTPAQVGVYSLCAALGTIAAILRDFGVSEYLIQERDLTRDKVRSAFGVALVTAWVLAALVFFSRGALARYFNEPGVAQVLAVTTLHFLILPLSSPAFALLNREMAFHRIFVLQLACNAAHAATSVLLAWRGYGTMSLAWGPVVHVTLQTLLLAWMRPADSFVLPAFTQARAVLRFGAAYMSSRTIETLAQNFHEPVIAKAFDFASVGLFSRAVGMVEMFRTHVADAITRVATPAFAAEHRAGRPVAGVFVRATAIFACISWPFFGFVALAAPEIVRVLFGAQWVAAAPLASVLALAALPSGLYEFVPQMFSATGQVRRRLLLSLWLSPLHMAAVLAASLIGLQAVAAASVFSSLVMLFLCGWHLRQALALRAIEWLGPCASGAAVAGVSVAAQWATLAACRGAGSPAIVTLLAGLASGIAAWLVMAMALRHPALAELRAAWRLLRPQAAAAP